MAHRGCSKTGCAASAVATLTYVYADQTAVLGPLAPEHVPGCYDLCAVHCDQLSAPRGWEVIRLGEIDRQPPAPADDDLLALADAVREVGLRPDEYPAAAPLPDDPDVVVLAERRHLRVLGQRPRQDASSPLD